MSTDDKTVMIREDLFQHLEEDAKRKKCTIDDLLLEILQNHQQKRQESQEKRFNLTVNIKDDEVKVEKITEIVRASDLLANS